MHQLISRLQQTVSRTSYLLFNSLCFTALLALSQKQPSTQLGTVTSEEANNISEGPVTNFVEVLRVCGSLGALFVALQFYFLTWPTSRTTETEWSRNKVYLITGLTLFNPSLFLILLGTVGIDLLKVENAEIISSAVLVLALTFLRAGRTYLELIGCFLTFCLLLVTQSKVLVFPSVLCLVYVLSRVTHRFTQDEEAKIYNVGIYNSKETLVDPASPDSWESSSSIESTAEPRISYLKMNVFRCILAIAVMFNFFYKLSLIWSILVQSQAEIFRYIGFFKGREQNKALVDPDNTIPALNFPSVFYLMELLTGESNEVVKVFFSAITLAFVAPNMIQRLWAKPFPSLFITSLVYGTLYSFLLVGDNALITHSWLLIVPVTLTACDSTLDARLFLILSWTSAFMLLPLNTSPELKILKPVVLVLYCIFSFVALNQYHIAARKQWRIKVGKHGQALWLKKRDKWYLLGLVVQYIFREIVSESLLHILYTPGQSPSGSIVEQITLYVSNVYCFLGFLYCCNLSQEQLKRKNKLVESYMPSSPRASASPARPTYGGHRLNVELETLFLGSQDFKLALPSVESSQLYQRYVAA